MAADARPSDVQIRRALAECMTVDDIDDAMGWPRGTARRRRWMAPNHGGLPFADAELAGVALWFRSTFELWQQNPAAHAGRRQGRHGQAPSGTVGRSTRSADDATDGRPAPLPTSPADSVDRNQPGGTTDVVDAETGAGPSEDVDATPAADDAGLRHSEALRPGRGDSSAPADTSNSAERATEVVHAGVEEPAGQLDEQDDLNAGTPPAESAAEADERVEGEGEVLRVLSGLDLSLGQLVLAEISGHWREARVSSRDHGTVLVEYQLNDTPLGARVRRLGVDRVRVRSPEQSES